MADIFVTEEFVDGAKEDCDEIPAQSLQVEVTDEDKEPQKTSDSDAECATETPGIAEDMTVKQEEPDDPFLDDSLLFKPGDSPLPVGMLEKYVSSDITFNRQKVVHHLLETLRFVQKSKDEVTKVVQVLCTLSDDYDPNVRSELMGQFPYIAAFCNETGLNNVIQDYLLPILVSYLGAENNQVRKAAHSALLTIVEQKQIDAEAINEKICRLVVHLTDGIHPEDLRTDSIQLMCKLAVLVGKKVTEDLFLQRFCALCIDDQNYLRKACASTFGDICTTVGTEITEDLLLAKFTELCQDTAWSVRKACAENFMAVSSVVSREIRCNELTDIYITLLKDQSRWVRVTAYQCLGPFISTFAEPYKSGLYYNKGELIICDVHKLQDGERLNNKSTKNSPQSPEDSSSDVDKTKNVLESCDSIIPLSCSETSLTTSEIPRIPCHVGNYSAVIEVSCPTVTASAAKNCVIENSVSPNEYLENDHCEDELCKKVSWYTNKNKVNYINYSEKTKSDWFKSWYKKKFSSSNTSYMNGDCNEISDTVDFKGSESIQSDISSTNSPTINGLYIDSPELYTEPLNYRRIPVVNCVISNSKNQYGQESENKKINSIYSCDHNNFQDSLPETVVNGELVLNSAAEEQGSDNSVSFTDESAFNHFQYWRTPIPDIDLDCSNGDLCELQASASDFAMSSSSYRRRRRPDRRELIDKPCLAFEDLVNARRMKRLESNKVETLPGQNVITVYDQDIVPPELLLCYLNMIDSALSEIAHHCAYSLPAVAITLGRKFWPCLKETFDALSSDLQGFMMMWKVRRTVASSMHQLAVILGPEITSTDLLPVFSRFIKDLDEVRIGILQHLSEFLKELQPEERKQFLPSLSEFLVSNSETESKEKNWRFRLILAEQLVSVADLYEPEDVKEHLVPLSLTLIQDKICEVRLAAVRVVAAVMKRMSQYQTSALTKEVLSWLAEQFVHSTKWFRRQLYVYICQEIVVQNSLPADQFAEDALPQLLYLCWDRVPNVRIAIARCLAVILWPLETFSSPDSPHRELLLQTIHTLQSDLDVDVQFYANMVSAHECSCLQHGEFPNLGELPV